MPLIKGIIQKIKSTIFGLKAQLQHNNQHRVLRRKRNE
jgi:hypothetical protein